MARRRRKKNARDTQEKRETPRISLPFAAVVACFIVSRIAAGLAGVRFDSYRGVQLMHFIPEDLLRTELLKSVFHLHNQPPLFNLYLGVVYKLFGGNEIFVFHTVHLLLGLAACLAVYLLAVRLGASKPVAAAVACVFTVSPAAILFENLLYYTFPVTVMLVLSAILLHRFLDTGRMREGVLFFTVLALIVLTRSMFHIAWFVLWFAVVAVIRRDLLRTAALAAVIPFLLAVAPFIKNAWMFGEFATSSWLGMSLSKITTMKVPEDVRIGHVENGDISELALLPPFKPVWFYRQHTIIPEFEPTGVAVLDTEMYPNNGHNWNNAALLSISEQYRKDALFMLKAHPSTYLRGVLDSFRIYFFPAGDWFHFYASIDNISLIGAWEKVHNFVLCGQFTAFTNEKETDQFGYFGRARHMGFFLIVMYAAVIGWSVLHLFRAWKSGDVTKPASVTMLFILLNILYVAAVGNLLESGENERFRFIAHPLAMTALAVVIQRAVIDRLKNRGG